MMGSLKSIFKMWSGKNFVQGEKSAGGKGHEGSFQIKQHPTGFIGSDDDNILSTEYINVLTIFDEEIVRFLRMF